MQQIWSTGYTNVPVFCDGRLSVTTHVEVVVVTVVAAWKRAPMTWRPATEVGMTRPAVADRYTLNVDAGSILVAVLRTTALPPIWNQPYLLATTAAMATQSEEPPSTTPEVVVSLAVSA